MSISLVPSEYVVSQIKRLEGGQSADGKFRPYRDSVGVPTIGYGHTENVSMGARPLTEKQADALLRQDLKNKYIPQIASLARTYRWPDLNPNQVGALIIFGFNLGNGYFYPGHSIGDALKAHDLRGAAEAILLYNKAGSPPKVLGGLTTRRQFERKLFLTPYAPPETPEQRKVRLWRERLQRVRAEAARRKAAGQNPWPAGLHALADTLKRDIRRHR